MWEYNIFCDREDDYYLDFIAKQLSELISQNSGVMAKVNTGQFSQLSIGIEDNKKNIVSKLLKLAVCSVFCELMKERYLQDNMVIAEWGSDNFINHADKEFMPTFIKVCTYFDIEMEKSLTMRIIELGQSIHLQSYFHFRLKNLKNKWQELCNVTSNNVELFVQSENFIEIMKFLLNNLSTKCNNVILRCEDNCIVYHDDNKDLDIIMTINASENIKLLNKMVELNPMQIVIYATPEYQKVINLLSSLFEQRIKIVSL